MSINRGNIALVIGMLVAGTANTVITKCMLLFFSHSYSYAYKQQPGQQTGRQKDRMIVRTRLTGRDRTHICLCDRAKYVCQRPRLLRVLLYQFNIRFSLSLPSSLSFF